MADQGWPAEVDETGAGITAPFNAPSQGPPPWNVYRITTHSVTVTLGTEPGGLTRFSSSLSPEHTANGSPPVVGRSTRTLRVTIGQ